MWAREECIGVSACGRIGVVKVWRGSSEPIGKSLFQFNNRSFASGTAHMKFALPTFLIYADTPTRRYADTFFYPSSASCSTWSIVSTGRNCSR